MAQDAEAPAPRDRRRFLRGAAAVAGTVAAGTAAADAVRGAAAGHAAGAADGIPPGRGMPGAAAPAGPAAPLTAGPAPAAAAASALEAGPFTPYGQPAAAESGVVRRIGLNHRGLATNGAAWTPLEQLDGTITPNGLHFVRNHGGTPTIDPARHRLRLVGRVRQPLAWDLAALLGLPRRSVVAFLECAGNSSAGWFQEPVQRPAGLIHGLVSNAEWTGVPLALLLDEAGVDPAAGWLVATGGDAGAFHISLPMALARERGLIGLFQNGERLRPENGHPLRLVLPGLKGSLWVKWLHTLEASEQPAMARDETAHYTQLGPDGRAEQFRFTMDVKSLITQPSHGQALTRRGLHEIRGLAWSGHGAIRRVEVSSDGGARWTEAALDGPVLPRAFTRFRLPWRWEGERALLQSRATDETGRVQPSREALIAARGRGSFYHHHAIVTWAVEPHGAVLHSHGEDF